MFKKYLFFVLSMLLVVSQTFAADLLDFVPADSTLIVRTNLQQLTSIPEIKAEIEAMMNREDNEYVKQVQAAGFSPVQDIHSLVLFMPLDKISSVSTTDSNVAFIAEGKFDVQKIIDSLVNSVNNNNEVNKKVEVSNEDGYNTIVLRNPDKGDVKMVFFDTSTVAIGSLSGVSNVKEVFLGHQKNIKTNPTFAGSVAKLNVNATLAAVSVVTDDVKQFLAGNENSKVLANMDFIAFDLTKSNDVSINITGDFKAATDMKAVENCLKKFGEDLKGNKAPYAVLNDFANNYKVNVNNMSATVSTLISKASIDKLIENEGQPEK